MAKDTAPLIRRYSHLAFALETTTGTAASLSASNAVTPIYNADMKFNTELIERESEGKMGDMLQHFGAQAAALTFSIDVFGSGASGLPDWTKLLQGCGFVESGGVFTPITGATDTLTFGLYTNGRLKRMIGAMGEFTIRKRRGQKASIDWSFIGVAERPSDTSILSPTKTTVIPPREATTTIGGTAFRQPEIVIEHRNGVFLREDTDAVNSGGDATGYRAAYIAGPRRTTIRVSPEASLLATKDWYAIRRASTTQAFSMALGATSNNTITPAAPKAQLVAEPQDGERNRMLTDDLEFVATRNSDAGDNEFSITFS